MGKSGSERRRRGSKKKGEALTEVMMRRHMEICYGVLHKDR